MGNMDRLYNLLKDESYQHAIERLSWEDSNAYGQKAQSIAARVKNEVTAVSNVDIKPGSDMFALTSYIGHSLAKMYKTILLSDASDQSKIELANAVKNIEQVAAQFAQSVSLKRAEAKKREAECKANNINLAGVTPSVSEKSSSKSLLGYLSSLFRSKNSDIQDTKGSQS